jgi:glycosyltransferase involved in cell wall biosynthesis
VSLREVVAPPARFVARQVVNARTRSWAKHSRLFAVGERTGWSVDADARHLESTARRLGYAVAPSGWARFAGNQAVFLASHFEALQPRWLDSSHRLATAYLHGRPGTPGYPEFDRAFRSLHSAPARFARIQVTHDEMRDLVMDAGVEPRAVHLVPIGIDLENFPLGDASARNRAREAFDLPESAFVVGSFQKDGVGWGDGLEPKLVKGPDLLIATLERIKIDAPEVFVLLTGPARGYVRRELERIAIPFRHLLATDRAELARAYHALDVYLVTSRQEGGPKGMLESMATGTPLVTTRVGQVSRIATNGADALVANVDDVDALSGQVLRSREDAGLRSALVSAGRATAERYAYERLDPAWDALLAGFVVRSER